MITNYFLTLIYNILWVILYPFRLLPNATLPTGLKNAIELSGQYTQPLSVVLPLGTLATIVGLFLTFETAVLSWKGINWLIRRIPTQS